MSRQVGQARRQARPNVPRVLHRVCLRKNRDGVPSSGTSIVSDCGSWAADATRRPGTTDCPSLPARPSLPSSRRDLEEDDALRAADVDDAGVLDPSRDSGRGRADRRRHRRDRSRRHRRRSRRHHRHHRHRAALVRAGARSSGSGIFRWCWAACTRRWCPRKRSAMPTAWSWGMPRNRGRSCCGTSRRAACSAATIKAPG